MKLYAVTLNFAGSSYITSQLYFATKQEAERYIEENSDDMFQLTLNDDQVDLSSVLEETNHMSERVAMDEYKRIMRG